MRTYRFSALTVDDDVVSGRVRAAHMSSARAELFSRGLHRIELSEHRSRIRLPFEVTRSKVSRSDVLALTRHLQGYLSAGMQLLPALDGIALEYPNPAFRAVLLDVSSRVAGGTRFADALAAHPNVFDDSYVAMVRAAEATNRLDEVLEDVAVHLERDHDSRARLKSEAMTPMITLFVAFATVLVLVVFALPKFAAFFANFDAELPVTTRMLLVVSGTLQQWGLQILAGTLLSGLLFVVFLRSERGRAWRDRVLLRIPVLRELVRCTVISRFCRVLGSMLVSGVPAHEAVALAAAATNNRVYRDGLAPVQAAVVQGEGVAVPLTRTNLFPVNVCQVVRSGEDSGTLGPQLTRLSDFYAKEAVHRLTRVMAFFQPALFIVVALVVGFVALAMVSAMYGAFGQMR